MGTLEAIVTKMKKNGSFNQDLWGSNSTIYPTKQSIRTWEEQQHARK